METKMRGRALAYWLCLMLSFVGVSSSAQAQLEPREDPIEEQVASSFAINDADPESSVPSAQEAMKKPLQMGYHVMLLSERAEAATNRGDHAAAARFWRALAKASPDRALPFVRACASSERAGEFENALEMCRAALGKQGVTVSDYQHFVQLVLRKPGQLSATDVADVEAIAAHFREQLPKDEAELQQNITLCHLGSRMADPARMTTCTKRLQEIAPKDPQTLVFSWSLAMLQRDFDQANAVLDNARKSNLAASAISAMQDAIRVAREQNASFGQRLAGSWVVRSMVILTLLGLGMLMFYKRRQRVQV